MSSVNKTKVCILEKRKSVSPRTNMYINGEKIYIVNDFTYLGNYCNNTGSMRNAC